MSNRTDADDVVLRQSCEAADVGKQNWAEIAYDIYQTLDSLRKYAGSKEAWNEADRVLNEYREMMEASK